MMNELVFTYVQHTTQVIPQTFIFCYFNYCLHWAS